MEFIEQEDGWERPAVFVEFCPIQWRPLVGGAEYRADPLVKLHIVTDWEGSAVDGSDFKDEALSVFDLSDMIHKELRRLSGETFDRFDLVESLTNHDHEDIVENIDVYKCAAYKVMK